MKFNCSPLCTWGPSVCVCVCVCERVCVCEGERKREAWVLNQNCPAMGVNVMALPEELSLFKDAL